MTPSMPLMFLRPSCGPAYRPLSWFLRSRPSRMPLKAKITNPAFLNSSANMSTTSTIPKEEPGDDPDDVIFNNFYGARTIELNRPQKLNSLNGSMARKVIARLLEWQKSHMASVVIIGGAGPKAFCAGGDVAALAQMNTSGPQGRAASQAYFGLEYQLDHVVATYQKPYVAYMDGITMGGGVGLSVHAPIRIATERTLFAMPETTIGLFPDVGGSFFLPRLDGYIGTYLALTSERLKGVNAFYAGIATHYIDSATLPNLTYRLAELQFKDYDDLRTRLQAVSATISEFSSGLPPHEPPLLTGPLRSAIDRCFKHSTVEDIIKALEHEASSSPPPSDATTGFSASEWATQTLKTLSTRSPTSLKATLRAQRQGLNWGIAETFQREYHLAGSFMAHPDFTSGVTARLISKPPTTPKWSPATLSEVSDEAIDAMFDPSSPSSASSASSASSSSSTSTSNGNSNSNETNRRLYLPNLASSGSSATRDYKTYPFHFGLPKEDSIADTIRQGGWRVRALVQKFENERRELVSGGGEVVGVRGKIEEIVRRMCTVDEHGVVEWVGDGV